MAEDEPTEVSKEAALTAALDNFKRNASLEDWRSICAELSKRTRDRSRVFTPDEYAAIAPIWEQMDAKVAEMDARSTEDED